MVLSEMRKPLMVLDRHRYTWIRQNAEGFILEVGAQDGSLWRLPKLPPFLFIPLINLEKDVVLFDCDVWKQNVPSVFVRGDAHHLPFQDNTFDTVILDHILEHVIDPKATLSEAKRVTRNKIIVNVPNEFEWDPSFKGCRTREQAMEEDIRQAGGYDKATAKKIEISSEYAKCTAHLDDRKFKHFYHVRFFNEQSFLELLETVDLPFEAFKLYYRWRTFSDWAAIIRK